MRCKNCGWENQEGSIRCSKCNAPLTGSMVDRGPIQAPPVLEQPLSGTVKEAPEAYQAYEPQAPVAPQAQQAAPMEVSSCPRCGYPIRPDMNVCPSCGVPLKQQMGGTVNNWINPAQGVFCTLKPIAWINEGIDYQPVSYSGDKIVLKRANTDANNNSISSRAQAQLTHDGQNWYLENKSEQETTFIKVRRKTKLEPGDIIVLGNRLFEFQG